MSGQTPYSLIRNYCNSSEHKNNKLIEKILVHTFYREYDEMVKQEKAKRPTLSEEELNGFKTSLLSDINLKKNEEIAIAEIEACVKSKTRMLEFQYKIKSSLAVVGLNVLSSVIFTVILIVTFFIAENQIRPLVNDFLSNPIQIEDKK